MTRMIAIVAVLFAATGSVRGSSIEAVFGFEPRLVLPEGTTMQSIKAFGAVGDGKTDDTEAFLKAFGKNQPRAIYIPAGTYLVNKQIRYGIEDKQKKKVTLIGESRSRSIIRLADNSPGFGDASKPLAFIHARHPQQQGEQNMHMYVQHLTIEIGRGNPGAIGLEYHTNNTGAVKDVTIRAIDPSSPGAVGLACNEWEVGPGNARYVTVENFRTGIQMHKIGNYMTLEHVTIRNCPVGLDTRSTSVRKLVVEGAQQAIKLDGQLVLIDSKLSGTGESAIKLEGKSSLLARNVAIEGFTSLAPKVAATEGEVVIGSHLALGADRAYTLNLPIEESPERQYPQSADEWAVMPARGDITKPLQAAIDSGVRTIYIQGGQQNEISDTIYVRGNVERIMGLGNAYIKCLTPGKPAFVLEDGASDVVISELIYGNYGSTSTVRWQQASPRTLVYRHGEGGFESTESAKGGRVFIESVVGHPFHFTGVQAWVRDIDTEMGGPDHANIVNRGSSLWILGHKTEDFSTKIATHGGKTELLGGTYRQNWDDDDFKQKGIDDANRPPLFLVENGVASFTYMSWGPQKPFTTLVRLKSGETVKDLDRATHGGSAILVRAESNP
ncbi:glycoside hydrolase family 55 protein [Oscillatoria amoena NRMC-F 0135]|nr:glycoside hydrolase family 55 protein [Oscillatoria amoena NRMC-F 0135]